MPGAYEGVALGVVVKVAHQHQEEVVVVVVAVYVDCFGPGFIRDAGSQFFLDELIHRYVGLELGANSLAVHLHGRYGLVFTADLFKFDLQQVFYEIQPVSLALKRANLQLPEGDVPVLKNLLQVDCFDQFLFGLDQAL